MEKQATALQSVETATLLISMEQSTLDAYKVKDEAEFKKNLAEDYVGVTDDGIQSVEDDIANMKRFDLEKLDSKDQKLFFPTPHIGVLTYTMMVEGSYNGNSITNTIYTSTVYVSRDSEWKAVLHTESIAD